MRELLTQLEQVNADLGPPLAYLAGRQIVLDEPPVRAAVRRAELLLATGGDPRRELELDGSAVRAVAADLDEPLARAELLRGLERLHGESEGLPAVAAALSRLREEPELAWQAYACALLADALDAD
ncbi:MAG: hypothetical protein H0U07_10630 [Actinobacteria bacterium]|nr:hypothetical protein [Actinomycetota bacterium]MDQ3161368.1 hypothetical protein [Actinomycetota bacterium]